MSFLGQTLSLPVCSSFSDVDSGTAAVFLSATETDLQIAINMGDFATTYGIAVKETMADKSFQWHYAEGVNGPVEFTISLDTAGGYYEEYLMHQLAYTNVRTDYPHLNDTDFANFRAVAATGMGKNVLYRTTSPIDPSIGRSAIADAALREAGVTVVMNLSDTKETAVSYAGYENSYYATTNYLPLNMGVDFAARTFSRSWRRVSAFLPRIRAFMPSTVRRAKTAPAL